MFKYLLNLNKTVYYYIIKTTEMTYLLFFYQYYSNVPNVQVCLLVFQALEVRAHGHRPAVPPAERWSPAAPWRRPLLHPEPHTRLHQHSQGLLLLLCVCVCVTCVSVWVCVCVWCYADRSCHDWKHYVVHHLWPAINSKPCGSCSHGLSLNTALGSYYILNRTVFAHTKSTNQERQQYV